MAFPDEQTLVDAVNKNITTSKYWGGIVFTNLDLESNITYKIRLSAKLRNSGSGYDLINFLDFIIELLLFFFLCLLL